MAKAVANGSPAPAAADGPLNTQAGPSLFALADTLGGNAHLLSLGSEEISRVALEAAKSIFDYGAYMCNKQSHLLRRPLYSQNLY